VTSSNIRYEILFTTGVFIQSQNLIKSPAKCMAPLPMRLTGTQTQNKIETCSRGISSSGEGIIQQNHIVISIIEYRYIDGTLGSLVSYLMLAAQVGVLDAV